MSRRDGCAVESSLPGRMRMRLPQPRRRESIAARVRSDLGHVEGVRNVLVNILTGSVLVLYDPDALDADELVDAARDADIVSDVGGAAEAVEEAPWPEVSALGKQIVNWVRELDRSIRQASGGLIDLKLLIPLVLLALALARAIASGRRTPMPWYTLMWYAYSTFVHGHSPFAGRLGKPT